MSKSKRVRWTPEEADAVMSVIVLHYLETGKLEIPKDDAGWMLVQVQAGLPMKRRKKSLSENTRWLIKSAILDSLQLGFPDYTEEEANQKNIRVFAFNSPHYSFNSPESVGTLQRAVKETLTDVGGALKEELPYYSTSAPDAMIKQEMLNHLLTVNRHATLDDLMKMSEFRKISSLRMKECWDEVVKTYDAKLGTSPSPAPEKKTRISSLVVSGQEGNVSANGVNINWTTEGEFAIFRIQGKVPKNACISLSVEAD